MKKHYLLSILFFWFVLSIHGNEQSISTEYFVGDWIFSTEEPYMKKYVIKFDGVITYTEENEIESEIKYAVYSPKRPDKSIVVYLRSEGTWKLNNNELIESYEKPMTIDVGESFDMKMSQQFAKAVRKSLKKEYINYLNSISLNSFIITCDSISYEMHRKTKKQDLTNQL